MLRKFLLWRIIKGFTYTILIALFLLLNWITNYYIENGLPIKESSVNNAKTPLKEAQFDLKEPVSANELSPVAVEVIFPQETDTIEREIDGWIIINNPESELLLVNKERRLPDNFIPTQLIVPEVRFPMEEFVEKKQMKAVAALALESLFNAAEDEGHILFAISGYRSYERQVTLHNYYIKTRGIKYTKQVSAYPGSSEHQTGYSMDISTSSENFQLNTSFGKTPEGIWVAENAHKFGFIIRYPEDKIDITGYTFEPWHLRYVGNPHATYLYLNNLTLEEVYEIQKPLS